MPIQTYSIDSSDFAAIRTGDAGQLVSRQTPVPRVGDYVELLFSAENKATICKVTSVRSSQSFSAAFKSPYYSAAVRVVARLGW